MNSKTLNVPAKKVRDGSHMIYYITFSCLCDFPQYLIGGS